MHIKLHGRLFISGEIVVKTGLHIGGSGGTFSIGGNDNPVVINPITREPYIPGSSLRGKMRSLTEKAYGVPLVHHANVRMHTCENKADYERSPIAQVYGIPAAEGFGLPTRLIVRDVVLTENARKALLEAKTDLPFTEVKTEVSIDRITSQANPRSLERVPAGAVFGPMGLVYSVFTEQDIDSLKVLLDGMELLEDDYLGGYGSRGSGKIVFQNLELLLKRYGDFIQPVAVIGPERFDTLADLSAHFLDIQDTLRRWLFDGT